MEIFKINIPKGTRYISDWKEFGFDMFPEKCIIDKQIPGCGYTEWCITNDKNVILASPRKMLLQNKKDQHPSDVYLVVNENDKELQVDTDISKEVEIKIDNSADIDPSLIYKRLFDEISGFCQDSILHNKPIKILVTYDSYHIVRDILLHLGLFDKFYTVVDEYQSILHDARFKSDTELQFMDVIKDVQKVQFISATPTLEKYSSMLDEFKDLPFYVLDWYELDHGRVKKPDLKILTMKSIGEKLPVIVERYKSNDFDKTFVRGEDGNIETIYSDEAVFYVNSVNHIISMIKKCQLKPEEVNILCSDTPDNRIRLKKKLGKEYTIGTIPLKGEKPKMFTFCTRTVYLGADFYSTCAQSYIFSDSNIECLAVDISQDLPQILGRQRLKENPWKNSATFYYRTTAEYNKMSRENFDMILRQKADNTNKLLNIYDETRLDNQAILSKKYEEVVKQKHYENDYVAVTKGIPVFNNFAYVSEVRAFDIQQIDYADRFTVFAEVSKISENDNEGVIKLLNKYRTMTTQYDRLKFICEYCFSNRDKLDIILNQLSSLDPIKKYIVGLGIDKCKALSYDTGKINKTLNIVYFNRENLNREVYAIINVGDKYTKSHLKAILQNIYDSVGYQKTAKASDIENWFNIMSTSVKDDSGKYSVGFKILSKKGEE